MSLYRSLVQSFDSIYRISIPETKSENFLEPSATPQVRARAFGEICLLTTGGLIGVRCRPGVYLSSYWRLLLALDHDVRQRRASKHEPWTICVWFRRKSQ